MDIIDKFNFKNGEELKEIYLKSDVLLLTCVFKNFIKYHLMNLKSMFYIVLVYLVILGSVA